jgi:hypothetical protein
MLAKWQRLARISLAKSPPARTMLLRSLVGCEREKSPGRSFIASKKEYLRDFLPILSFIFAVSSGKYFAK